MVKISIISLATLATFTFSTIPGINSKNSSIQSHELAVGKCVAKLPYQQGNEMQIVLEEKSNDGTVIIPSKAFKDVEENQPIQLTLDFDGVRYDLNVTTTQFKQEPAITAKVNSNILYELSNSQYLKIFHDNALINNISLYNSFEIIEDIQMCKNGL